MSEESPDDSEHSSESVEIALVGSVTAEAGWSNSTPFLPCTHDQKKPTSCTQFGGSKWGSLPGKY